MKFKLSLALAAATLTIAAPAQARDQWTKSAANGWYAGQPWLVGANYNPATAINQFEMWQADSFDPATIDKELGWARGIGMNTTIGVVATDAALEHGAVQRLAAMAQGGYAYAIRPIHTPFDGGSARSDQQAGRRT